MKPHFDNFGYGYPNHLDRQPASFGYRSRGYGLHPRRHIPYNHRPSAYLEYEEFHSKKDYRNPPADYQFPPSCDQFHQTDNRFLTTDYQLSPTNDEFLSKYCRFSPMRNTSNNWNYSSPVPRNQSPMILPNGQRFRNRPNSIEGTPVPDYPRRRRFSHTRAIPRGQYRHVKRLNKASLHRFHTKILVPVPQRDIHENYPPYPLKELQAARSVLINELHSEQGGVRLLRVRMAVGMFKNIPEEELTCSMSYDHQATFLLTVPLPTPSRDVHVPDGELC